MGATETILLSFTSTFNTTKVGKFSDMTKYFVLKIFNRRKKKKHHVSQRSAPPNQLTSNQIIISYAVFDTLFLSVWVSYIPQWDI